MATFRDDQVLNNRDPENFASGHQFFGQVYIVLAGLKVSTRVVVR